MAATTEVGAMVVRLTGDSTQYRAMLGGAVSATKSAGAKISSLGRSLSLRVTAPLAIIGGLSVRAFAAFDQAMTESTSIMDVTADQTARMRQVALELSTRAAKGPTDLAKAYFYLASAGKNAEQSMALLPQVAQFATAGAFDMALATDLLTDAQSALGLSTKDVVKDTENLTRVADVLVTANVLANASVQQFSESLTRQAGAALKSFGKDIEEGVAVLAALADQGVKAELAGNALDRMIRLLNKSALDNADAHKELGFRVYDAAGDMRNLGDIVANLEQILHGASDQTKAAKLDMLGFEARIQGVILPLLGTSDAIKRYEKELRNAGGTTKDVADKQMKSFSNQLNLFKNQLTLVGIEIGQALAPMISMLTGLLKSGIKIWGGLDDTVRSIVLGVGLFAAALGPLLVLVGGVTTAVMTLTAAYVAMTATAAGAAAATATLAVALQVATGAIVFTAIIAGFVALKMAIDEANESAREAAKLLQSAVDRHRTWIAGLEEGAQKREAISNEYRRLAGQVRNDEKQHARERTEASERALRESRAAIVEFERWAGTLRAQTAERTAAAAAAAQQAQNEKDVADALQAAAAAEAEVSKQAARAKELTDQYADEATKLREEMDELVHFLVTGQIGADTYARGMDNLNRALEALREPAQDMSALFAEGKQVTEQFMTTNEKFVARKAELQKLLAAGAIGMETYERAMIDAEKQTKKDYTVKFDVQGLSAIEAGSAQARAMLAATQVTLPLLTRAKRFGVDGLGQGAQVAMQPVAAGLPGDKEQVGSMANSLRRLVDLEEQNQRRGAVTIETAGLS